MTFRSIIFAGVSAFALAAPAFSENLGIIVSNLNYKTQPDLRSGAQVERIEEALKGAGFSVVFMQNMNLDRSAERLGAMRGRIADAERLIVVINGHVATADGRAWLLVPDAKRPTDFSLGSMGLPLAPFVDAAGERPGAAIIAVADQARLPRVGAGVTPGFVPGELPQGVMALSGDARDLAGLFEDGLLDGGRSTAQVLEAHSDVRAAGFVPALGGFMPPPVEAIGGEPIAGLVVAEPDAPELTPEELMALEEAELGLSREDRRRVQRSLAILGFDPRGIDGLIGPGSRRAIRGYQVDRRLEATGFMSAPMLEQLFDEAAIRSAELEEEARRRQAEAEARDTAYWRDTGQGGDEAGMRAYLDRFPDGLFADVARTRLQAIEDARRPIVSRSEQRTWDQAVASDDRNGYRDYLTLYPDGAYRVDAETRLGELAAEEDQAEANKRYAAEERQVAGNRVARRLVENRLASLGLEPGPVDGEFDEDTRRALRRYQEARGLPVTGYVNQATMVRILIGN